MSILALRRGRGPAFPDLPPTLQPHAILAAAPPSDTLRAASLSALTYLLLAGGAVILASFGPKAILAPVLPPAPPWRPVELDGPPRTRPVERVIPTVAGGTGSGTVAAPSGTSPRADPDEAAAGLPTVDRSSEVPVDGPALPGPVVPASGAAVPASGPVIHDFSATAPAVLRQVDPLYPDLARRAHVQGTVVLLMVVDEAGVPIQVRVLDGPPALQEAALHAARQWRFEPARMDGRAVAASFRLTLNFRLR
ncbi:energy transducer TonB [Geothrix fuzhouensis]|uniref:energy transducer TonB n=1 Tax=Geothrix fuzhouensis TaxID=2966451 RepID=UPI0021482966|nr:energy transducer TonB [Geothrix fuzhouensis]